MISDAAARGHVPQFDGLALTYSPLFIAQQSDVVAADGDRTLRGLLATAKLHATRNDLAAAHACMARAFSLYGEPADAAWENYVKSAVVCRQLDLAASLLNGRYGGCPAFSLVLGGEDSASWPIHTFRYRISGRRNGEIQIHRSLYDNRHTEFMIHRLLSVLPLLSSHAAHNDAETGSINLNIGDTGSVPGLAFCENRPQFFLLPDNYFIESKGYAKLHRHLTQHPIAWADRAPVAFWRGATTGRQDNPKLGWRSLPRVKLCEIAQTDQTGLFDVGISSLELMPGHPARDAIATSGLMRPYVPATEFHKYKYQIDIDGHSNSWPGLFQKLLTGSPVLKVASPRCYRQWYYGRLKPWVNFVPVAADMSDLVEKIRWLHEHDDTARAIGEQGQALALSMDFEGEVQRAGRTISAALRYFALRPETELHFGAGHGGNACLRDGWSELRADGVVAGGFESRLRLPRPVADEDFVLSLDLSLPAEPPAPSPQRVIVLANGEVLLEAALTERQILHFPLSRRTIEADEALSITVLHPDGKMAASAVHPLDTRIASMVLHRLLLTPAGTHATHGLPPSPTAKHEESASPPAQQPMRLLEACIEQTRILTSHDSVVFADPATGQLRHGPLAFSPGNVFLAAEGDLACLLHQGPDGVKRPIRVLPGVDPRPGSGFAHEDTASPDQFRMAAAPGSAFGLARSGLLLCAESDGRITLSRQQLGPWERFRKLPA
jgi:hypothetical protein